MIRPGWIPPRSPYSLIQEDLWVPTAAGEWLILVSCIMLNCTTRKQVDKVLPKFVARWPRPYDFMGALEEDVGAVIRPLGFATRRTANLKKMTERFVAGPWSDPRELPGVGEYAARAWEIFCQGQLGDSPPKDHALVQYWHWASGLANVVIDQAFDDVVPDKECHVGDCPDEGSDADQLSGRIECSAA